MRLDTRGGGEPEAIFAKISLSPLYHPSHLHTPNQRRATAQEMHQDPTCKPLTSPTSPFPLSLSQANADQSAPVGDRGLDSTPAPAAALVDAQTHRPRRPTHSSRPRRL
jgi:hypothetical protein